ncbi:MAG: lamin tail domain-containing protein [Oscillospiraceae bacterium]|nr:lamin tail domain-containing protein [Oscillospiraceae bacterium]
MKRFFRLQKSARSRVWRVRTIQYILAVFLISGMLIMLSYITAGRDFPASSQVQAEETAGRIVIGEAMSSNKTVIPDDFGTFSDWLELTNVTSETINLRGVGLSDGGSDVKFVFPEYKLAPSAYVVVYLSGTHANDPAKPFHAPFKLSADGETLYLFEATGLIAQSLAVPPMEPDNSYALMSDDTYAITLSATPGYPNTEEGYTAFRTTSLIDLSNLRLNEVCPLNRSVIFDEDGIASDWIELINTGDRTINLSGFGISDNETKWNKWTFPSGASIAPHSVMTVFASSGKESLNESFKGEYYHTNFSLSGDGETVILSNAYGQLIDKVRVEGVDKDQSLERPEGGSDWRVTGAATPGSANGKAGLEELDAKLRLNNKYGIIITEALTYTAGMDTPHGKSSYDWIEILNTGTEAVNLAGFGLSDKPGRPRLWQFPSVTIQPGEYRIIFCSGVAAAPSGQLHASFGLSALGEILTLSDPNGDIIDRLAVPALAAETSYGRSLAKGELLYFDKPTPGLANAPGSPGFSTAPTVSVPGGSYKNSVTTELFVSGNGVIRYTLDGSDPTESSAVYAGPLEFNRTTILRARAFEDGLRPSAIITDTYLINQYHALPVISLVSEPDGLWNPVSGILAGSYLDSAKTEIPYDDLPYWQKNSVAGHFEFFETDGTRVVSEGVELKLNGNFSLDLPQKSFRVSAKARYGSTELPYAFFPDRPYDTYYSLVIRNGGNDGAYTRLIDGFQSRIIDMMDTTVYHMPWRPVVVYLNGEYWGHYNLRERIDTDSLARYEGWSDPDNIDLIEGVNEVHNGSYDDFRALLRFVDSHDLNDPAALQTVLNWIDVDNYFDFIIFQMYSGNTDAANIKQYRLREDGAKWRWTLYDLDWGLFQSDRNGPAIWLDPKGSGVADINNKIILRLLEVPSMRDKFLRRYGYLFQTVFVPDNMIEILHEMAAQLEPEMPMHFARWASYNTPRLNIEPSANAESALAYWRGRLTRLETTIRNRGYHEWGYVQNWFKLSDQQMVDYFGTRPAKVN